MRPRTGVVVLLFALASSLTTVHAQQLVYTPINPSFGGSPFNASWLLSEAQAQNSFTESATLEASKSAFDPLEQFKQSLNSQILSQISRQLISKAFGESGEVKPGHYEFGDYVIDITSVLEGINISIIDYATGGTTSILIPYY